MTEQDRRENRCERCGGKFRPNDERAEVAEQVDPTERGPLVETRSQIIHASCMREGEEIA